MRREVPLVITFVAGCVFVIQYFIPHPPFDAFEQVFTDWFAIVQAFAIWLGALSLLKFSALKIQRRQRDWFMSVIIIVGFVVMVAYGAYDGFAGMKADPTYSFRDNGTHFDWLYRNIYTPLSSTMFALLAFFVASASYRAFRARNVQATLLLVAGIFVMIGRVPVGDELSLLIGLPEGFQSSDLATWVMNFPNAAGHRAIMIGIALGTVSTSLRIILGIERSHLEG
jgi:hypothetical protein